MALTEFEERTSTDEVMCLECKKADPTGQGTWIKRRAARKHLESTAHATALKKLAALEADMLKDAAARTEIYGSGQSSAQLESAFTKLLQTSSIARNAMFDQPQATLSTANFTSESNEIFSEFSEASDQPAPRLNHSYIIPAGVQPLTEDSSTRNQRFLDMFEEMLLQGDHEDELGRDEGDEDFIDVALDLDEVQDPDEIVQHFSALPVENDYSPYPNKLVRMKYILLRQMLTYNIQMMMLDILDNLPRLRMSSNQFRLILWVLKEAGIANVPSYDAFRNIQKQLREACGSEPI